MRLSASLITNYCNINMFSFSPINQWAVRAGDPNTLYFQLVDLDQSGIRYFTGIGSSNLPVTVTVTMPSIDNSKIVQSTALPTGDPSIWSINIASTQIPSSGNVIFMVKEGNSTRTFQIMNALAVEIPGASGSC